MPTKVIIIVAGTSLTLPSDWDSTNGVIEVIAGGYSGDIYNGGSGGGYAKKIGFGLPSASYSINIGQGGVFSGGFSVGGNTWISNTGGQPSAAGQGVLALSGSTQLNFDATAVYAGGPGGTASLPAFANRHGGGGGGAAGPAGIGGFGTPGTNGARGQGGSGGPGGGGAGGTSVGGVVTDGSPGAYWVATSIGITGVGLSVLPIGAGAGPGGGGAGSDYAFEIPAGSAGLFGGAGGGGSYNAGDVVNTDGGNGAQGVMILSYIPGGGVVLPPIPISSMYQAAKGNAFIMFD